MNNKFTSNRKRIFTLLMAAALVLALFAGCGSADTAEESAVQETTEVVETASETSTTEGGAEDSGTRTIKDLSGNEVELPAELERIAFTSWPAGEAITIILERPDLLATLSTTCASNKYISKYYPELSSLETTPDISDGSVEEFIAAGVQLVFTSESYREQFESAGIAVLVPDTSSVDTIIDTILMMGEAFGDEAYAKAQEIAEYYNGNMDRLNAVSDTLSDDERPRVYYAASGLTNTEGLGSITNFWIEAAGGINVATENGVEGTFVDIDAGSLLEWNPDIIVLRDAEFYEQLQNDSVLSQLDAVKNGKVYVAPKGIYNWAVRAAEASIMPLWAATIINPELFSDIDIEQECYDFHKNFYGMDLTDDEVYDILHPAGI